MNAEDQKPVLAEADDFEKEAEALSKSVPFQQFLDDRSRSQRRFTLDEIEAEVDAELAKPS
jgi:hypothetical protein